MNENIDLPKELLYKEGNIWVNGKNNQLRYNVKDNETAWLNPISTYKVGTIETLKKGQPVSIGLLSQLCTEASGAGDNAIVLADPSINQFSVGLLLEPGNVASTKEVHVQSHGQFVYELINKTKEENYYLPPNDGKKFLWSYSDIGKPVYVSNKNKGELTLDLAEATYNGGTIICIGRLADAPLGTENNISFQKIVIEIQLSGDVRGVVDTSQLSVLMEPESAQTIESIESNYDQIIAVKIINGTGHIITKTADLRNNSQYDIVGVFVAPSKNGKVDLKPFYNKSITVTRLGIVNGNFGFSPNTFGRTGFIYDGKLSFTEIDDNVEYKVGVGFGADKFLVDCRYAKNIKSAEMIGTIKPVFDNSLVDVGFVKIDQEVHKIYDEEIEWESLIRYCYAKDIFVFSKNKNGPFTRVNEGEWELLGETTDNGILSKSKPTYFKFRDIYYTLNDGQTCACQIKYTKEGSPENQAYVWPEQCYQLSVPFKKNGTNGGKLNNSNLKINISHLVDLGAYMDNKGQNIESYDIVVQEKESKQIISPGFWQKPDGTWVGYEWQIVTNGTQTYLYMITVPENTEASNCLGITWPIGTKYNGDIELFVTVRRRPTQYNAIYLNQYPIDNPWTPLVDSANNLVIQGDRIYLGGKVDRNEGQSGFTREKSTSIQVSHGGKDEPAAVTYHIISPTEDNAKVFKQSFVIGDGDNSKTIEWTYDISEDVPVASLNATFAAQFTAESTKNENPTDIYNDSALKIFKVLYPHIYKKESNNVETISITNARIEEYLSNDFYEFTLFDEELRNKLSKKDSTKLKVLNGDNQLNTAIKDAWKNKDSISFQSYFGILARAAGETEERLLKLERFLYGSDFKNAYETKEELNTKYNYYIDDLGILRYFSFLEDYGLFDSNNKIDFKDAGINNIALAENIKSLLLNFIVDNYGSYSENDTYDGDEDEKHKKIRSSYEEFNKISSKEDLIQFLSKAFTDKISNSGLSHIAELWINYKSQNIFNTIVNNTHNFRINGEKKVAETVTNWNLKVSELKNVYLSKLINGYNTDIENFGNSPVFKGCPYNWPIDNSNEVNKETGTIRNWEDRTGFTLEENFFGNNIVGVSDETGDYYVYNSGNSFAITKKKEDYEGQPATFSSQSLEGIIYDIIIKLSFLRKQFSVDGKLDSKRTFISSFSNMKFKTTTVPIFTSIDEGNMFNEISDTHNVYSAFQFDNDKIVAGYSTMLGPKQPFYEFTNYDKFSENSGDGAVLVASRWDANKWSVYVGGYSLCNPSQIYMVYVLCCLAKIEVEVATKLKDAFGSQSVSAETKEALAGTDDDDDDNDDDDIEPTEEELAAGKIEAINAAEKYNKLLEDCFLYGHTLSSKATVTQTKTAPAFKDESLGKAFVKALKLNTAKLPKVVANPNSSSATNIISQLTGIDLTFLQENIGFKLCRFDEEDMINQLFEPAIHLRSQINNSLVDDDLLNDWSRLLCEGFTIEENSPFYNFNNGLNKALETIAAANGADAISTVFLSNFFPTFESYYDGYKTLSTETLWQMYDRDTYNRRALSYSETNFALNKRISEHYPKSAEYRLFFGFLNGITAENSEYFYDEPWTQQPIANNNLIWKDKNGGQHSADFNNYIQKGLNFIENLPKNEKLNISDEVIICDKIIKPKDDDINIPLVSSSDKVLDESGDWIQARNLDLDDVEEPQPDDRSPILGYRDVGTVEQVVDVDLDTAEIIKKIQLSKDNFIYNESDLETEKKEIIKYKTTVDENGETIYELDENGDKIIESTETVEEILPLINENKLVAKSLVGAVIALCQKLGIDYNDFIKDYVNSEDNPYTGKVFELPKRNSSYIVTLQSLHKYKEKMFYIKPLKELTLTNNFAHGIISKKTETGVNSNGNIDYTKETFKFDGSDIASSKILENKFAFKDKSYIHGFMLPRPDIKIKTKAEDLLSLVEMQYSEEPDTLKIKKQKDKSVPNINFDQTYELYSIEDTLSRRIIITLDDIDYIVTDICLMKIGVQKLNADITNAPLTFFGGLNFKLDGEQYEKEPTKYPKKQMYSGKQNYFIHFKINLLNRDEDKTPSWCRIGTPDKQYKSQIGDNKNFSTTYTYEINADVNNAIAVKQLNYDTWARFLIKNSDILYLVDQDVTFNYDEGCIDYRETGINAWSDVNIGGLINSSIQCAVGPILRGDIKWRLQN